MYRQGKDVGRIFKEIRFILTKLADVEREESVSPVCRASISPHQDPRSHNKHSLADLRVNSLLSPSSPPSNIYAESGFLRVEEIVKPL